jgi:hypothetical protein
MLAKLGGTSMATSATDPQLATDLDPLGKATASHRTSQPDETPPDIKTL